MGNFIEQSAEDIMLNSMANVFMPEALDPVGKEDDDIDNDGDVDKSDKYLHKRRKAVGKAIAADKAKRMKKEEIELHLRTKIGELTEKKLYKSEKATNSDEKEITIEEKPVKNTVVINPDVQEGNQLDEFLGGKPGDGYIGHPNLDIKNPLAKKQVKKPVLPGSKGGGLVNRTGAGIGDIRMRQNQAVQNMLRNSYNQEGETIEEKSGAATPTTRERIARVDAGKDPYPLKSAGEKERLSLGIKDIDMGVSPVKDGHAKFMKSLGLGVASGSTPKQKGGEAAPKKGAPTTAGASPSAPKQSTKGKEGPKAKKLSTVDTGSSTNVRDTIDSIKKKIQKEDYRSSLDASMKADAAANRAAIRARAEAGMKKLDAQGGAIKAIQGLRKKAGVDYENQPNMVNTAPGIYRSKSAIEADKPLQQRLSELPSAQKRAQVDAARTKRMMSAPMRQESTIEDKLHMVLERTRYAKEKGKDFKTGKDSKKGGTRDGKSAFDKVSKEMRKTGGVMSSRGKAIQPQGKKKKKGKKGYEGATPVDKIKNKLAQKRRKQPDPYRARAGESD